MMAAIGHFMAPERLVEVRFTLTTAHVDRCIDAPYAFIHEPDLALWSVVRRHWTPYMFVWTSGIC